jgi:hypothetical protein
MPHTIINNSKVLFIHIPKTGGTTIEHWMSTYGKLYAYQPKISSFMKCSPQHLTYDEATLILGHDFDFSFSVVRNPYKRIESEYFFTTKRNNRALKLDFSSWVLSSLDEFAKNRHYADNHFRPQSDFLSDNITKVYRLEQGLKKVLNKVCGILGVEELEQLRPRNVSKRHEIHWTFEAINAVNEVYKDDFKLFKYKVIAPTIIIE